LEATDAIGNADSNSLETLISHYIAVSQLANSK